MKRTIEFCDYPTSKLPSQEVIDLPTAISDLVNAAPTGKVFVKDAAASSAEVTIVQFFRNLDGGGTVRAAVHFQGSGHDGVEDDGESERAEVEESILEVATMVVDVSVGMWGDRAPDGRECCRIALAGVPPNERRPLGPQQNFWSPFILAIAEVNPETPLGVVGLAEGNPFDADGAKFVRLIREYGI